MAAVVGLGLLLALGGLVLSPALAADATTPGWFDATGTADRLGGWPDLTWVGTPTYQPGFAAQGDAFGFTGSNGLRGGHPAFGDLPGGAFTVQFDVQTQQVPAAGTTIDLTSKRAVGDYWQAQLLPNGHVRFELSGAGDTASVESAGIVNDNRWHTVTVERATTLCITIDGQVAAQMCSPATAAAVTPTGATLEVANGHPALGTGVAPLVGLVDNLYVGPAPPVNLVATAPSFTAATGTEVTVWYEVVNPNSSSSSATLDFDLPPGVSPAATGSKCRIVATNAVCDGGVSAAYPPGKVTVLLRLNVDGSVAPGTTLTLSATWRPTTAPDRAPANNTQVALAITTQRSLAVVGAPAPAPPSMVAGSPVAPPAAGEPTAPPATTPPVTAAPAAPTTTVPRPRELPRVDKRPLRPALAAVTLAGGARSARAGVGLHLSGSGYQCPTVYFFLDGTALAQTTPSPSGDVDVREATLPGDAAPGRHTITASCAPSGRPTESAATFDVESSTWHRSALVTALPHPNDIDWGPAAIAGSAVVAAALTFVLGFPSELFDRTLDENYDEIRRWFRLREAPATDTKRSRRRLIAAGFFFGAALLSSFLDPGFGLHAASLITYMACLGSILAVFVVFNAPEIVHMWRRFHSRGTLQVRPGTLVIAGIFVAASRFLHLQPGYLYGLLAGVVFQHEIPGDRKGRVAAGSVVAVLVVGLASWFGWNALSEPASADNASPALLVFEAMLGTVFLASIVTSAFAVLPMRILEGRSILKWSRRAWTVLSIVAFFLLFHIVLRPHGGYASESQHSSLVNSGISFAVFALFSVAFWAYFRFQRRPIGAAET